MEISSQLCDTVAASLVGKQLSSFSLLTSIVRDSISEALHRVLTPSRRIDVLAGVVAAKAEMRPYVIVFVGVNGVGKSTSLSKVAIGFA